MTCNHSSGSESVLETLSRDESAIVAEWLKNVVRDDPDGRFLTEEQDQFRNPYGAMLRERFPILFRYILCGAPELAILEALDPIIRIHVVRRPDCAGTVSFVAVLRRITRERLKAAGIGEEDDALTALNARMDGIERAASEIFHRCRRQIREIKENSARRQRFVSEKIAQAMNARSPS